MADFDERVEPLAPVWASAPVRPIQLDRRLRDRGDQGPAFDNPTVAATTGGSLPAAYAQAAIDENTQGLVIRVRDATTNLVLSELPSSQVDQIAHELDEYVETARRRGRLPHGMAS